jgi:hypothetical protein
MRCRNCLFAAAPLAALALAGCGGGGGGDTTAASVPTVEESPALSKADLIQQGDSICAEVNAAVGTVDASEAEASDQVSQAADLYSGMVERLKALGTPEEDAGYAEFTEAADELAQAESDALLASERGDESGLTEAQASADEALEAFEEAAGAYGFKDCSEAPSAPSVPPTSAGSGSGGAAVEEVVPEEEAVPEEVAPEEEAAPEEVAPETGGAGETEGGGTGTGGGGESAGGGSGGIGPG